MLSPASANVSRTENIALIGIRRKQFAPTNHPDRQVDPEDPTTEVDKHLQSMIKSKIL